MEIFKLSLRRAVLVVGNKSDLEIYRSELDSYKATVSISVVFFVANIA